MSWVAAAVAGSTLVSGIYSSNQEGKAADKAAGLQSDAAAAGIAQQNKQFEAIQALLKPYVDAGTGAIGGQKDLIGLNGAPAQQQAIDALKASPQFTSLLAQGEESILANASATGGLRGGNTQAALAQFSPALLAQVINDQYGRLGGMVKLGQNSAAGVGDAGITTGNNISNLLQQQGAALAGGALAQGKAQAGYANAITGSIGSFIGAGGFSRTPTITTPTTTTSATDPYSLAGMGARFGGKF